jgi:hypothetical protein
MERDEPMFSIKRPPDLPQTGEVKGPTKQRRWLRHVFGLLGFLITLGLILVTVVQNLGSTLETKFKSVEQGVRR